MVTGGLSYVGFAITARSVYIKQMTHQFRSITCNRSCIYKSVQSKDCTDFYVFGIIGLSHNVYLISTKTNTTISNTTF